MTKIFAEKSVPSIFRTMTAGVSLVRTENFRR